MKERLAIVFWAVALGSWPFLFHADITKHKGPFDLALDGIAIAWSLLRTAEYVKNGKLS